MQRIAEKCREMQRNAEMQRYRHDLHGLYDLHDTRECHIWHHWTPCNLAIAHVGSYTNLKNLVEVWRNWWLHAWSFNQMDSIGFVPLTIFIIHKTGLSVCWHSLFRSCFPKWIPSFRLNGCCCILTNFNGFWHPDWGQHLNTYSVHSF